MFGHKSVPSRKGGVEVVVDELGRRLVGLGCEVTCYNRKAKEYRRVPGNVYEGMSLKYVFTINKKGFAALTSSVCAAIRIAFCRTDIVHIHAEGPATMAGFLKLFGKRVVVTVHGLDWQRSKWGGFASWYIRLGEKTAVKHADEIIVLSRNVKSYFEREYGRETVFIPNGVNRPGIADDEFIQKAYGLKKDSYILFLGRLVPEKGLELLIRTFKELDTDKKLVIAGGSSDTDRFEREMRDLAYDDKRIQFIGHVEGEALSAIYSNAYVYVLPSSLEGMPLSLLEAMSYKNCCLVSDIDECTEVVGEHAAVFKAGDGKDLRDKLAMLIENPELVKEYKAGAQDYICERYSWGAVAEQTLEIYKKVLKRGN